jgi:hypothetical protein
MKNVDRPPSNPKRIIIQSTQECFSVDIPRVPAETVRHEKGRLLMRTMTLCHYPRSVTSTTVLGKS